MVFEGVGLEEGGEFGDFGVGDAGVSFADVEEFGWISGLALARGRPPRRTAKV